MDEKLIKKAYQIDFSKISEGFLYSEVICYADNKNKAKSLLLNKLKEDYLDVKLQYDYDEKVVTYLTIPVIRCESADKYLFEFEEMTRYKINEILENRKRVSALNKILEDETVKYCYIRKGAYYRPNSSGYTDYLHRAGVFTKEYAVSHAISVREISIIPINIDEHNQLIESEISELKTRILC